MFSIHNPRLSILAGESGQASIIHFSITLPYLNENDTAHGYSHLCLHQYSSHLEMDLIEEEWPGFEPRTSWFKTNCFTICYVYLILVFLQMANQDSIQT